LRVLDGLEEPIARVSALALYLLDTQLMFPKLPAYGEKRGRQHDAAQISEMLSKYVGANVGY